MATLYKNDGHAATVARQRARRAVVAGKARWLDSKPAVTEVRQPTRPPVRHARTPFGQGLGERRPIYRAPVSLSDMAWWTAQSQDAMPAGWEVEMAEEEQRMLDRRFDEYRAQERLERGLDV